MTWDVAIAGASGALAYRTYHWLALKVAQRGMAKSERIRRNLVVKLDTALLPELAKAVEDEMVRRARLVGRRGLA